MLIGDLDQALGVNEEVTVVAKAYGHRYGQAIAFRNVL